MPQTPYYLIDERRLRHNLETVQRVRDLSGARSVLALKCFSAWSVFGLMRDYLDGVTCSSLFEARLGRDEFDKEVHAYSVAFAADEIAEVAAVADKVIFNSVSQLKAFGSAVAGRSVGLRVNPGVSYSHFDLADPARLHSRLGVSDEPSLRAVAPLLDGVMFHFNCENSDFDALATSVQHIVETYQWLLEQVQWVSLGGGIAFTGEGYPLQRFVELLRGLSSRFGVQIYLEPGEAVVTGCTELVTTVLDVVHNGVDIAIVDASLEAHMLDHLIYSTTPRLSYPGPGDNQMTIAGRTCLAGDVFGAHSMAEPLRVGSEVRFADAGGYTMVKANWFNGVGMPSIVVRRLDESIDVVREFDYADFKGSLS
ncbi:MAG: carboxynorspermidine decarboxylase [Ilumatobacteraceae bacterium]